MRVDVLEVVTRGAPRGTRPCDGCRQVVPELHECRVHAGSSAYYWDLCSRCRGHLRGLPDLPADKKKADARWDKVLASLRQREGGVAASRRPYSAAAASGDPSSLPAGESA